jgi:hypothetical protein
LRPLRRALRCAPRFKLTRWVQTSLCVVACGPVFAGGAIMQVKIAFSRSELGAVLEVV